MKQSRTRTGKPAAAPDGRDGDWMLQKADAIKGFLAQQRGRTWQSSRKTAWLLAWEQLATEADLASKQVQQVLQPHAVSCAELQQQLADLAAQQQELGAETQEQQLQLLGQVQELRGLAKRAQYMGLAAELHPSEAAALASLQQELQWLQQDTQQQLLGLAASAQALIAELAAAAPGSCGPTGSMLDGLLDSSALSGGGLAGSESSDAAAAAAAAAVVVGAEAAPGPGPVAAADRGLPDDITAAGQAVQVDNLKVTHQAPERESREHETPDDATPQAAAAAAPQHDGKAASLLSDICALADPNQPTHAAAEGGSLCAACAAFKPAAANKTSAEPAATTAATAAAPGCGKPGSCGDWASAVSTPTSSSTAVANPEAAADLATGNTAAVSSSCGGAGSATSRNASSSNGACNSFKAAAEAEAAAAAGETISALPPAAAAPMDVELQELLCQHSFAPSSLRQQLLATYAALLQKHQQQVCACSGQQRTHAAQCQGWSPDEHALFAWLRAQALQTMTVSGPGQAVATTGSRAAQRAASGQLQSRCSTAHTASSGSKGRGGGGTGSGCSSRAPAVVAGQGCSRANLVNYLALRMPGKSRQQLVEHDTWHTTAIQLQRRAEDLQDSWQRQRAAFMAAASSSLAEASVSTAAAAEAAASHLSSAVSRQLLHHQLEGIHMMKQQQEAVAAAQQAAAAAAQATQEAEVAAARQQRTQEQKALVMQYKQVVAQQQLQADAAAEQLRLASSQAVEAAIEASRPAVAVRQADALQRLQQQQEQQRQRGAETEARQHRLAAIAAALGPKLERDPERVLQHTAASSAAAPEVGQAFKPVHGFTAQQVVADPRFRLVEALRNAGALRGGASSVGYLKQALTRLQ